LFLKLEKLYNHTPKGKYCIEIKRSASAAVSRGFYEVIIDAQPEKSFVIVPDGESYPKDCNIWVMNLDDFLKKELPVLSAN